MPGFEPQTLRYKLHGYCSNPFSPDPDPYETFSPESRDSVQVASEAILKSQETRRELRAAIDNKKLLQVSAHNTVNEGLTRKLAETVTLTVNILN